MNQVISLAGLEPAIRNVETDVVVGRVAGSGYDARDPDLKAKFDAVLWDGHEISVYPRQPLEHAVLVIAGNEARSGYPGLKNCEPEPDPKRVEFALGKLMADVVSTLARGLVEYHGGALGKETKHRFADLIVEIFRIRWASAFGSFDGETRQYEPYFFDVWVRERVTFGREKTDGFLFTLSCSLRSWSLVVTLLVQSTNISTAYPETYSLRLLELELVLSLPHF